MSYYYRVSGAQIVQYRFTSYVLIMCSCGIICPALEVYRPTLVWMAAFTTLQSRELWFGWVFPASLSLQREWCIGEIPNVELLPSRDLAVLPFSEELPKLMSGE